MYVIVLCWGEVVVGFILYFIPSSATFCRYSCCCCCIFSLLFFKALLFIVGPIRLSLFCTVLYCSLSFVSYLISFFYFIPIFVVAERFVFFSVCALWLFVSFCLPTFKFKSCIVVAYNVNASVVVGFKYHCWLFLFLLLFVFVSIVLPCFHYTMSVCLCVCIHSKN